DLPIVNVMDDGGVINENGGKYAGMPGMEARKQIVKDLEAGGYLVRVEPIKHNVGTCCRCHTVVEPRVSTQWFVKMEPLARPAVDAVKNGEIHFIPERMDKIYYNWMENIKDWCISRQLWWGHRIPAWYCEDCGETIVSETDLDTCPKCGGKHLHQDNDTLDTWFSSALWPFSTLGWPENTEELKYFYPTDTLVTGYDIIFFWVARMIFSGLEHMKDIPFKTVFFHGLVRDAQGRKMSKSLGNGIDPVEVIDQYGADALRFTLVTGNSPGNDMRFSDEKVAASRNFANKIWNAARFIHMNIDGKDVPCALPETLSLEDKWIVGRFQTVTKEITENMDKFELGIAVAKLYDFLWDDFCDWYIELAKIRMNGEDEVSAQNARQVLVWTLSNTLKLLHPFMPFITEEIWQSLPHEGEALIVAKWPEFEEKLSFPKEEGEMKKVMELITGVRTRRSEMNVPPSKKAHLYVETATPEAFETEREAILRLAYCSGLEIGSGFEMGEGSVTVVTAACKGYLPMDDLVDKAAETARLQKELESAQKQLQNAEAKLQNEAFIGKAPQKVIDGVKDNAEKLREKVRMIEESLKAFQ
ncbi:MAG: valine--tRNA ligase, partial [Acutalibacter sp.]|nr:valine--tRNA ligase [Acutalibacter sp.]